MVGEGSGWDIDPAAAARFFEASLKVGMNLMQGPASNFQSVTQVFRSLLDLPPDVHVVHVGLHARAARL
jgi:meso-butanediol dehydrogenase/(S,S)-butanediol dehydrogenase/diacetyl reductase